MEDTSSYDVIVVGAGPAGAAAAYFLSEAGQKVVVLEKASLPRYKACGGGLSVQMLEKYFPFSCQPVFELQAKSVSYALGSHFVTIPVGRSSMRLVMRERFDAFVLSHSSVEVRDGQAVRRVEETGDEVKVEIADGTILHARYLIGADGANSVVAHQVGLRPHRTLLGAIEAEAYVPPEVLQRFADGPVFIVGEIKQGYLWIFPKADHLSVGIDALHPQAGELQAVLKRVMARYGISLDGVPLHGHPIPIYTQDEPVSTARTFLVGDAAGLADPFSGEGIRLAIKSSRLAADAILSGRPELYSRQVLRHIGFDHAMGWIVAWFFFTFTRLSFALFVPNPIVTRAFLDMLSDRASYVDVMLRGILTLPVFLPVQAFKGLLRLLTRAKGPRLSALPDKTGENPPKGRA